MCYKEEKHRKVIIQLEEKMREVPDFISDFFDRYKSATTRNCNWSYIQNLLLWLINKRYINKKDMSEITPEDLNSVTSNQIIKYLNDLKNGISGNKNSLDSIGTKKNVFSAFWNYLFLNKYVDDNIIRHIPKHLYKSENTQKIIKIPTEEQLSAFVSRLTEGNGNEFNIVRNLAIVKLIMGSGIRSEELINLDIKDLYLDDKRPYIMILGKGKLEHYDKVFISYEAKMYLKDYLTSRSLFIEENNLQTQALFLSNEKKRISKEVMNNLFRRYSDGNIYPHMLRHWVGTKLYEQTKDIVLVQRQLRHSSLETAAKYYVHISENDIADIMLNI